MKKSFVITLALVFILGIAGTAFAANPFTDVPANHWAYASISKLAQSGIIDGYGDGRFIGNSNMTRYEMAQIVAKAMANSDKADAALKSQIQKLAAEFSKELNALGVRVAKLEKNADNVKITGEIRFSNFSNNDTVKSTTKWANGTWLRSRIWLTGQVNDSWKYGAMLENNQNMATNAQDTATGTTGPEVESSTMFRRAWVEGKVGVINVTAGRWYEAPLRGIVLGEAGDGLKVGFTNKEFKFNVMAIRPQLNNNDLLGTGAQNNQVFAAVATYNPKKWDLGVAYYHTDRTGATGDAFVAVDGVSAKSASIYEALVAYNFQNDLKLWGQLFNGSKDINNGGKSGWAMGLDLGKMVRSKPGTWNARLTYYDVPAAAYINSSIEADPAYATSARGMSNGTSTKFDGFKGVNVGASFVAAKNIDINFDYYSFKHQNKINGDTSAKTYWSYVRFYF